jgi:crotonobetainyl-CoA:carnitine CoA-transferase CaiB-like acyl-CoA transferase
MLSLSLQSFLLASPGETSPSGGARFAPIGLYDAYDGRFQIAIGPQADFRRFAAVIERPDLAENPDYASLELRIANRLALEAEVVPAFLSQNLQTWLDRFSEANVMFSPVYNYEQMMADPQVRFRDVFVTTRHQMGGDVKMIRNPLRMSETPIDTYASPPLLGEHTDAVLRDVLGLDEAQIAALHASGAVRSGRVKATTAG